MKKPDPDFNRFRTALFCGVPDRVPIAEIDVDFEVMGAFLGKPIITIEDQVEFWYKAGYDYARVDMGAMEANMLFSEKARPKEGWRQTIQKRSLYDDNPDQVRGFISESKGAITSWQDFEKFPWPKENEYDYSHIERAGKIIPDGMKLVISCAGIFTMTWILMGFETFSFALVEDEKLIEALFEKTGAHHYKYFKDALDFENVQAIWYGDDLAYTEGLMVSPAVYRKYLFPWMKKIGKLCKAKNVPYIHHSDGKLWQIMDDYKEIGINALHPIEPKAMDIREVKEKVGDHFCLIGNIDLGYTLTRGTPEEVDAEVKQRIRDIAPGGGYCLGSSNSVTNYVPLENYKAMIDAAFKYGAYPITV